MKTTIEGRALAPHERRYVELVGRHLRDVPAGVRERLLRDVHDHLVERPATANPDALWSQLGSPRAYAVELRRAHDLGSERTGPRARWKASPRRLRVRVVAAVLITTALAGAGIAIEVRRSAWQPPLIENNGSRAIFVGAHPFQGISISSTAESRQYSVAYDSHRNLQLTLFFASDRAVLLKRVDLDAPPRSYFTVVKTEVAPFYPHEPFRPFEPITMTPNRPVMTRTTFRFQNCQSSSPGTSETYESVRVTYSASGHTRTRDVKLYTLLAMNTPPISSCPGEHQ